MRLTSLCLMKWAQCSELRAIIKGWAIASSEVSRVSSNSRLRYVYQKWQLHLKVVFIRSLCPDGRLQSALSA